MAKALLGYMSNADPLAMAQLTAENRRLRQHVGDLEALVLRLETENDALASAVHGSPMLELDDTMQPV